MATAAAGSSSSNSSRFALTCGLLRQYMREHQQPPPPPPRSIAALRPPVEAEKVDARTMQLFPPRAGMPEQPPAQERHRAALTIFYDGRVLVFGDFPADKAKELMELARSESSPAVPVPQKLVAPEPPMLSYLPMARKASLQRFLQKRKDRIITGEPYKKKVAASPTEKDVAAIKLVKGEPSTWLGL